MTIEVFPFGRWSGDAGDYVVVARKFATIDWIEKSPFEKIPHSNALEVDEAHLVNGGLFIAA